MVWQESITANKILLFQMQHNISTNYCNQIMKTTAKAIDVNNIFVDVLVTPATITSTFVIELQ